MDSQKIFRSNLPKPVPGVKAPGITLSAQEPHMNEQAQEPQAEPAYVPSTRRPLASLKLPPFKCVPNGRVRR